MTIVLRFQIWRELVKNSIDFKFFFQCSKSNPSRTQVDNSSQSGDNNYAEVLNNKFKEFQLSTLTFIQTRLFITLFFQISPTFSSNSITIAWDSLYNSCTEPSISNYSHMQSNNSTNSNNTNYQNAREETWIIYCIIADSAFNVPLTDAKCDFPLAFKRTWPWIRTLGRFKHVTFVFCTSIFSQISTLFYQPAFSNRLLPTAILQNSILHLFTLFHPIFQFFFFFEGFVYYLVHLSFMFLSTR